MADDDRPHDWDPEREKRQTDPDALARSFVRAAADEQAKIEKEEAARRKEIGDLGRPVSSFLMPAPPALDLQLSVHKIKNGIVVTYGQGPHGHPLTIDLAETEYAKDPEAAIGAVLRIVREFFLSSTGPLAAPGVLPPGAFGEEPA